MEKVPEDSKDAASSRDPTQAPADVFSSGSERGGKTGVQHKQDIVTAKPSVNTKSNFSNDAPQREKTAENTMLVSINDRKVKVGADSDSTSLYTLCRRWLRNDAPRKEQPGVQSFAKLLPKPLPPKKVSSDNFSAEENESEDVLEDYLDGEIEAPSEQELLENHIKRFKNVRKRLREQQKQRIERYKLRLALLLQPSPYQEKLDASLHY
eukprot:c19059_g1_i1 orf=244-870(-)